MKEPTAAAYAGTVVLKDAAESVGFRPETLRRWIRDGQLPAMVWGRTYRIKQTDLDAIVERHLAKKLPPRQEVPDGQVTWDDVLGQEPAVDGHSATDAAQPAKRVRTRKAKP